jgi:hypothetical protein
MWAILNHSRPLQRSINRGHLRISSCRSERGSPSSGKDVSISQSSILRNVSEGERPNFGNDVSFLQLEIQRLVSEGGSPTSGKDVRFLQS